MAKRKGGTRRAARENSVFDSLDEHERYYRALVDGEIERDEKDFAFPLRHSCGKESTESRSSKESAQDVLDAIEDLRDAIVKDDTVKAAHAAFIWGIRSTYDLAAHEIRMGYMGLKNAETLQRKNHRKKQETLRMVLVAYEEIAATGPLPEKRDTLVKRIVAATGLSERTVWGVLPGKQPAKGNGDQGPRVCDCCGKQIPPMERAKKTTASR